jgi:hypothetical protein
VRGKVLLAVFAFLLAGCQRNAPAPAPPILTPILPTATSLAEGWFTGPVKSPAANCTGQQPWFFENRASECATTVLNTWAVLQRFEHGLMVWVQEGGRTFVLLDDGSLFKPYHLVSDPSSQEELPGPDPSIVPPAGLYQPQLGFAKFWRGLVPGSEWVRERLGWALAPEVGYPALWQCNDATDSTARCYFSGPRDEIICLTQGSAQYWNYWQGPVR